MLLLLPPSETKRAGGAGVFQPAVLHEHKALSSAREAVRDALVALSQGDESIAAKSLKLGVKNRGELAYNLELSTSGVMPAIERYTGVVYDALEVTSINADAREWLDAHVYVQSALFGLVTAADEIPAYRLSAGSRLPALEAPLKRVWAAAHAGLTWPEESFVLDLRSNDYTALAPVPEGLGVTWHVVQRGSDGEVRALNHFNKAAKGDLVRRLALGGATPTNAAELVELARVLGLEMTLEPDGRNVTLITELGAPIGR